VIVRLVVDVREEHGNASLVPGLTKTGIDIWVRHKSGFQHNKYLVIDESIVTTGSYNFTVSADKRNAENLVVIRNAPQVVKAFTDDYENLLAAARLKK
jgi:phosphatidylserine/phosphatidylglycerophosphate/cardiolipin synthase-like enzyme